MWFADVEEISELAGVLTKWEPMLELEYQPLQGRLFESDATGYAVQLGPAATLFTDRRRVAVGEGDLVVIAPGLAVDVEPEANFLVLRHLGPRPPHFRERFIQVWGFEHFVWPAGGDRPMIAHDGRHRVGCEALGLDDGAGVSLSTPWWERALLIVRDGRVHVRTGTDSAELTRRQVALVETNGEWSLQGSGQVLWLRLVPEAIHEARRLESLRIGSPSASPEHRPD